ncbi:restriction endonuclease [Halorubrum ezzemoulense]|uniref:restriction endonuclease n=1 Tax=Halorubrum ezzemoulense TaxID=337243 RepID=UPI00232FC755|nr:restriction endonuclease [Halorubrum ezzemoulense]MDB2245237.1 restriction endonuclease [Halorubrum ezzemoulense]MDB2290093.1 restriction endonuclease [Halorubrum ezzemoulense]MDB2297563.1 restriction endonuclease [Halorubrum ezzemoulense]MDB2301143.1 restriction endonuclease [Halorubrum ezzemoulense]
MNEAISDLEVSEIIPALRSVYTDTDGIDHELAVDQLLTRCDEKPPNDPEWHRSVLTQLEDRSQCSFALDRFDTLLASFEDQGIPTGKVIKLTTLTASAIVLADATLQYPRLHRRATTQAINDAIRANLSQKRVATAGQRTLVIAEAIAYSAAISQQSMVFPHPDDSRAEFDSIIENNLASGSFESIVSMYEELSDRRNEGWTQTDLLEFTPREFEELLAACWRDFRNAAVTTQGSQDQGIDLIVRTSDGARLAVQAKRYNQANPVGIATVQRTAGLTTEFDIDRSVIVTSSEFTRQAKNSATSIDEVTIIDGEQLCSWLNHSSLSPPFNANQS